MSQLKGNVLITGGSGSLGTAIIKRAVEESWDARFTVMARNESKMQALRSLYPQVRCEIGDVRDESRLVSLFKGQDTVIHAAAIKIVPVAEANPREAILTNVMGSFNVLKAVIEAGVPQVIGISSDKACGPTYYGLTKRLMEGLFREASEWEADQKFVVCRYGNVLKSANSIVPLFYKQIAEGKPLTITVPNMTRFWLSMKQAIDLIIRTLDEAESGEILVPQAPAMQLQQLAHAVAPPNYPIDVIGIRSGERYDETLIVEEEAIHTTLADGVFCIHHPRKSVTNLEPHYEYTSANPARWLSYTELHQMLEDS